MSARKDSDLVSVIVITYNSEKYVLETLDSIFNQTYENIELIISDDASNDNTVQLCKGWLNNKIDSFVNAVVLETAQNQGIPANCNKGIKKAKGEWIKIIAGDDTLFPDAIENNISFVQTNGELAHFVFSGISKMNANGMPMNDSTEEIDANFFANYSAKQQYKKLIMGGVLIPAVSGFIHKVSLQTLGYFDEKIPLCEDYPMWIKATSQGHKLYFFNQITAQYRVHQTSVMSKKSIRYHQSLQRVFFKYRLFPLLKFNPLLAIEVFIWNVTRTLPFINQIIPYVLPSTYILYLKNRGSK